MSSSTGYYLKGVDPVMLGSNNLSELTNAATARTNLGVAIGSDVQAYNANLTTLAGYTPDNDGTLAANSATRLPTQQAVKSYVGSALSGLYTAGVGLLLTGAQFSIDSTVATLAGTQTLTNKSIVATQLTGTLQAAQFPALTGDVTTVAGALATTIASSAVTLAKMANMATASILGRNTAGTGAPEVLSASTTKTLLSLNNVENTALSTWAGSANITTLGTIGTGTWQGTPVGAIYGGTNSNTALSNNRMMVSSGSKIVETGAITTGQVLYADANGLPIGDSGLTYGGANILSAGTSGGGNGGFYSQQSNGNPNYSAETRSNTNFPLNLTSRARAANANLAISDVMARHDYSARANSTDTVLARMEAFYTGNGTTLLSSFRWLTYAPGSGGLIEVLRLTDDQKMVVGGTSAESRLHVIESSNEKVILGEMISSTLAPVIYTKRSRAAFANLAALDVAGIFRSVGRVNSSDLALSEFQTIYTGNGTTQNAGVALYLAAAGAPSARFSWLNDGTFRMFGSTSGSVGWKAPAMSPSVDWVMPTADAVGVFQSDGAGNSSVSFTLPYIKFGSTSDKIKMAMFTGTLSGSFGGEVNVTHGLDRSKIIGAFAQADDSAFWWPNGMTLFASRLFNFYIGASQVYLDNGSAASSILGQPYYITIFYKE